MIREIRPVFGLKLGLGAASLLSVLALVGRLISETFPDKAGLSLAGLIGLYFVSGALGGILFGVLLPLTKRLWGAVLVGIIVVSPYYILDSLLLARTTGSLGTSLFGGIVACVVIGGAIGWISWSAPQDGAEGDGVCKAGR